MFSTDDDDDTNAVEDTSSQSDPKEQNSPNNNVNLNDSTSGIIGNTTNSTVFKKYEGVVIVTKVLWQQDRQRLQQMLCFLSHSYNDKMQYDIVVFTTMPWNETEVKKLQTTVAPAKLTVVSEGPSLEERLASMTAEEVQFLRNRCGLGDNTHELTWFHHCTEVGARTPSNLGYSWQAEFRAYHLWNHPAIKDYRYMMWFDSDALVGREWDKDPMQVMIDNDLIALYAGWPYGTVSDKKVQAKMKKTYNKSICFVNNNNATSLDASFCEDDPKLKFQFGQIAGNHHITDLDVFRKDIHQKFLKDFTGDYKFSRLADDQMAVTIVALMEQNMRNEHTKVWRERGNGLTLKIAHHKMFDVERKERAPKNKVYFFHERKKEWSGLEERCSAYM